MSAGSGVKLIVGLGNPGPEYEATRHNAGAWFVKHLAERYNGVFRTETKFKGAACRIDLAGSECRLLLPTTFMNHSGSAVKAMASFYKIPTEAILIAHDELDLPVGTARLKHSGGHGGHNGLRDIISHLGSRDFDRLRLGIGHPGKEADVTNYVLKAPSRQDETHIFDAITRAIKIMPLLCEGKQQAAMQQLHE